MGFTGFLALAQFTHFYQGWIIQPSLGWILGATGVAKHEHPDAGVTEFLPECKGGGLEAD